MIFTSAEVDRILRIQDTAYDIFQWMKDCLNSGSLKFQIMHDATDSAANAHEWIERQRGSLPTSIVERLTDSKAVANLLLSFLTTSFELKAKPKTVSAGSRCGCGWCDWATRLTHLVLRHPSPRDYRTASDLMRLYLADLAANMDVKLGSDVSQLFERNESLTFELAHLTYVRESLRRTEFASQGTGVLALWRSIAWKDGRAIPKFRLTSSRVLDAQAIVTSVLKQQVS